MDIDFEKFACSLLEIEPNEENVERLKMLLNFYERRQTSNSGVSKIKRGLNKILNIPTERSEKRDYLYRDFLNTDFEEIKESETILVDEGDFFEEMANKLSNHLLSRKITFSAALIVSTLIWFFPSIFIEHPVLNKLMSIDFIFFIVSILWALTLLISIVVLIFTYKREKLIKEVVNNLKDTEKQYDWFKRFILVENVDTLRSPEFTKRKLCDFIFDQVSSKKIFVMGFEIAISNNLPYQVKEVISRSSDIIITTAIEKKIIKKDERCFGWHDRYILLSEI